MLTDRFQRPADARPVPTRALRGVLVSGMAALAVALLGTGCDEVIEEDCFEQTGTLTQVTTDTLTVDHLYPSLSPDGTRILFLTDFFVEGDQEEDDDAKEFGQGDYVLIDTPGPGEERPPTSMLTTIGNAKRLDFDERSADTFDEYGSLVQGLDAFKGESTWIDNERIIVAMENSRFLSRLFIYRIVGVAVSTVYEVEPLGIVEQDTLVERENEAVRRFKFGYRWPKVSPNGEWVAYSRFYYDEGQNLFDLSDDRFEQPAIFAANLNDGRVIRVTNGSAREDQPTWSPDGNSIAFTALGDKGIPEIYRVAFDPSQPAEKRGLNEAFTDGRRRLTTTPEQFRLPEASFEPTWTADNQIIFTSTRRPPCSSRRIRNLWIMGSDGSNARPLVLSEEDDALPAVANYDFAADGVDRMVVFVSRRNRDESFAGQKADLWVLRGGF